MIANYHTKSPCNLQLAPIITTRLKCQLWIVATTNRRPIIATLRRILPSHPSPSSSLAAWLTNLMRQGPIRNRSSRWYNSAKCETTQLWRSRAERKAFSRTIITTTTIWVWLNATSRMALPSGYLKSQMRRKADQVRARIKIQPQSKLAEEKSR